MPKTIKKIRTAPKTRTSADAGKNKKGQRRKGSNRNATSASRIISNSIFALTLKDKPAIEVVEKVDVRKHGFAASEEDDYMRMYHDLLASFQNAVKLVTGEETTFDPYKSGLDISVSLSYVLKGFENNILPKGCGYNIDKNDDGYYFTIYRGCEMNSWWHAFEVAPIVRYLKKTNNKLHNLFIILIRSFMSQSSIPGWWEGGMGYADYMLEERIEGFEEEEFEDQTEANNILDELIEAWMNYNYCEAKEYQERITAAPIYTPDKLLQKLSQFDHRNKLVKWMKAVCEFMKLPGCLHHFIYYEFEEEEQYEGLRLDQQVAVIWDWDDAFTGLQEECIEAEAQGCGVIEPMFNYQFTPNTKSFSIADFKLRCTWTSELSKIHELSREVINELKEKQKSKVRCKTAGHLC